MMKALLKNLKVWKQILFIQLNILVVFIEWVGNISFIDDVIFTIAHLPNHAKQVKTKATDNNN
jgi:hypothetical protein